MSNKQKRLPHLKQSRQLKPQIATGDNRVAVATKTQESSNEDAVKPTLDAEGLKIKVNLKHPPPEIIADILAVAQKQQVSGAVAQHLVGAKLALRYPERKIENHGHTTQDRQLGRKGDFELNDTIIHVTMTPGEAVVEKCARNVREGFNALLLAPRSEIIAARVFVGRAQAPNRIWVHSIEEFVGQNIAEIGEFRNQGLRENMRLLLQKYNERVAEAETRRALSIKIPENL
jgi:hypothetical protein